MGYHNGYGFPRYVSVAEGRRKAARELRQLEKKGHSTSPVVIEDDVIVGGNCGVYEGTVVRSRAVLGAGVILTRGTPVYDLVKETVHRATGDHPLIIPEGAVVVPGARRVSSAFGEAQGLSLQTPVIVKYRDDKTDAATALEAWLR